MTDDRGSLDAGQLRSIDPGRKDDAGKPRYDLFPVEAEAAIVDVLTFGAKEYGDDNWRGVENPSQRYYAAAKRHLAEWRRGHVLDPKSGLPHLAHAIASLVFLLELEKP